MANLYAHKFWTEFRERVIVLDRGKCVECGRSRESGVTLQVHHKLYKPGCKPWEYDPDECETLCRGCHAREHGEIRPDTGWEYVGEEDLGDLIGNCELCDNSIRYVHYIQHKYWEQIGVGTHCCDNLTGTREAAEGRRRLGRYTRFISSSNWLNDNDSLKIEYHRFSISIIHENKTYRLIINNIEGRKIFNTELDAKNFVFEFIDTGDAAKCSKLHPPKTRKKSTNS